MRMEYQILAAVGLDLLLGDPPWLPHPVRGLGLLAIKLEKLIRPLLPGETVAGLATALLVIAAAGAGVWGLMLVSAYLHPLAADMLAIVLIYFTIASRDLYQHSMNVFQALVRGDRQLARAYVGKMVGRDTQELNDSDITRAAVESIAESTVDGVTAPLFFAFLAGPIGAMVYRAINTLDSTFGYMDQCYRKFGWASAKLDDWANFIPARITAPLFSLSALFLKQRPLLSLRTLWRDGRKHSSPNAGLTEAAMAGALGVQLGGMNYYGGEPLEKPVLGEACVPLTARHIPLANALMLVTAGLFLILGLTVRIGIIHLYSLWKGGM